MNKRTPFDTSFVIPPRPRRVRLALLAARVITALLVMATPACYTLLKHPRVKRVVYEEVNDKRCSNCHYQDELWAFHNPGGQAEDFVGPWARYSVVPWWYNKYWYYDDAAASPPPASGNLRPSQARTAPLGSHHGPLPSPATSSTQSKEESNENPSKKRSAKPSGADESGRDSSGGKREK